MINKSVFTLLAVFISVAPLSILAAEADFEGRWTISLQDQKRRLVGLLELERRDDSWTAYLEGGPATVEIDGDHIVLVADSRDVRGFVFDRQFVGSLADNVMSGTYQQVGAVAQKEAPGPWYAEREVPADADGAPPKPVDITGMWTATQELDFRKYTMALTPMGKEWLENYLPYYDQPDVRCTSIGLPALATYSFPFEIIESENRFTMIYEYSSKVRRIWMDRRKPNEFMPPSRMGHSNGRWEGSTLIIDTMLLEKTVRDFRGELISENAHIEERYSLSEDGNVLTAVLTVFDPGSYERPPVRRRRWVRNADTEIFPYTCDPDSFYIPMFEAGEMEMYIDRTEQRF